MSRHASFACERTRGYLSLELDGELSSLEQRFLEAHSSRCEECRAYCTDVRTITDHLRSAPLETPARPVSVRRRARRASPLQLSAAAGVAVAILGTASLLNGTIGEDPPTRLGQQSPPVEAREIRVITASQLGGRSPTSGTTIVRPVDLLL